jgi:predicted MFS family arabinose efflux permease
VVGLTTLPVMGWLIDRTQPRYILWLAFLGQPLRALAISLIQTDLRLLMLPQLFHILTWAGPEIATVYYLTRLVGDENRGTALGFAYSVTVLGAMAGAPVSGEIAVHQGYPAMYRVAAAVAGLGFVTFTVCLWLRRRTAAAAASQEAAAGAAMGQPGR